MFTAILSLAIIVTAYQIVKLIVAMLRLKKINKHLTNNLK